MPIVTLNGKQVQWNPVETGEWGIADNVANPGGKPTYRHFARAANCLEWCYSFGPKSSCEYLAGRTKNNCWVKT